MSARDQLNSYIGQIERRLRRGVIIRGAAILAAGALATTVILVLIGYIFAFATWSVTSGRMVLFCVLVYSASVCLAVPLRRLNRRHAAAGEER